ncbi:hypothetical protein [Methylosinus sp. C49]|uniref:hypothetical protein n=1 Tax=Methylosinus sp. C49 TaxID=2699395 RepID=UPI00137A7005|nr:hypothetical protein [Methylosinus sp. C49]
MWVATPSLQWTFTTYSLPICPALQRNYLLKFSAQISAQILTLSSTIDRLSTEVAKVAGEVDGLRRERETLQQALVDAKQEMNDVAEAVVAGVTQQLEQQMEVFGPLARSSSSVETEASGL